MGHYSFNLHLGMSGDAVSGIVAKQTIPVYVTVDVYYFLFTLQCFDFYANIIASKPAYPDILLLSSFILCIFECTSYTGHIRPSNTHTRTHSRLS